MKISLERHWVFLVQQNPEGSEMQESAKILDVHRYSNSYFFYTLRASFFDQGLNR